MKWVHLIRQDLIIVRNCLNMLGGIDEALSSLTDDFRQESIIEADEGQEVAVSIVDGCIFYDGSVVQEQR